ncbi:hypothetical protein [Spirosoma luteum]|uniref:hypothetical protein n=1 Tax=Spirosoma luteum TaxID=431553 RepID=UPI00037BE71E|nr:hypothetical protein [Spirosoma luteum]
MAFSLFDRRGFLFGTSAMITATLLDSCLADPSDPTPAPGGGTTPPGSTTTAPGSTTTAPGSGTTTAPGSTTSVPVSSKGVIAAWGDSLTEGGQGGGTPYPQQLSTLLGRTVNNYGIDGQKAEQIVGRQGASTVTLSVEGNAFKGTAPVKVTAISIPILYTTGTDTRMVTGTVAGVPVTMTRTASGDGANRVETYTLTPKAASTTSVPANSVFTPDDAVASKGSVQILWMGRNDVPALSGVPALIDKAIGYIDAPARFLVIGVPFSLKEPKSTANYKLIESFNADLAARYLGNYVSIMPPTDAEMAAVGYSPTGEDRTYITNGQFPIGLHRDDIHFRTQGYQIIVNRIAAKLKEKGW